MLELYPVEQRGQAMAIWGVGVLVGPVLGPTLGGYLTEIYNWRWVFYVNLPFGILATHRPDSLLQGWRSAQGRAVRLARVYHAWPRCRRIATAA